MHANCILDSAVNLLVRHLVFVGNVQESPIASHLKGLDPSLEGLLNNIYLIAYQSSNFRDALPLSAGLEFFSGTHLSCRASGAKLLLVLNPGVLVLNHQNISDIPLLCHLVLLSISQIHGDPTANSDY